MSISIIIEWLFTSLMVSALLFLIGQTLIKNYRLKHAFYQYAFVLLLVLPIACLLLRSQGDPTYTLTRASHQSFETDLAAGFGKTPSSASSTGLEATNSSTQESRDAVIHDAPKAVTSAETYFSVKNLTLIFVALYLLGAIALFLKQYISLRLYCSKLPELRHSLPWLKCRILVTSDYSIPFCFGFFKPVIVLPENINDDKVIRLSLMHENGHIINGDPQFSYVQFFVKVVYFWNPMIWVMNRKFNEAQEIMADDYACRRMRDPASYATTVVDLIKSSRSLNIPALSSGMASQKHQLMIRFNVILNQKDKLNLTHPVIKKVSIAAASLLLYVAILQTGLFARDQGNLTTGNLTGEYADISAIDGQISASQQKQVFEIIAVLSWENNAWILNSLDGKKFTVVNPDEQTGIGRLPADVLYCTVTLVRKTPEGGDVLLGPWGNGSPGTEQGKQLEIELWEKIKAKKRELGDETWLEFHGDQPNP